MEVFRGGDGDPDVRDDARAVDVEQIERSAGSDGASVGVAAAAVVTGDAFLHIVMRLREGEKRFRVTGTRLRVERRGKEKRAGEKEEFAHGASQRRIRANLFYRGESVTPFERRISARCALRPRSGGEKAAVAAFLSATISWQAEWVARAHMFLGWLARWTVPARPCATSETCTG